MEANGESSTSSFHLKASLGSLILMEEVMDGLTDMMFGSGVTMGLMDPTYPVILQMCHLFGQNVICLLSKSEGSFFPDLMNVPRTDLIYLCSPNNPTGIAATQDDSPKSIYEIPGAREVAIEIGSFSKLAGFTGVRLGWVVVPESVVFANGQPVVKDYQKVISLVAPALVLQNPSEAFASFGLEAYGGLNSPYIWVKAPGQSSDDVFNQWLEKARILIIPGYMFGASGEGFLRVSSFGHRETILEAVGRLKALYPLCEKT
ncbi:hypothetical protein L7F22_065858 [Adiantum nelumboides]|nr:hypothetical protein [Adiantum nelumboides]